MNSSAESTLPRFDNMFRQTAAIIFVALTAAAVHVTVCFPGILTWDSKMQYKQAVSGELSDWHPPIMAALWRLLLPISTGGSALFILHIAIFWLGFAVIAIALTRDGKPACAILALALGLWPPIFFLATFLHKDVGFSVALVTGFALAMSRRVRTLQLGVVLGCLVAAALIYATLVRSNGIFAVAPVAVYAFRPNVMLAKRRLLTITVMSAALVVAAIPLTSVVNHRVLRASDAHAILSVVLYDMAGIAVRSRETTIYPTYQPILSNVDRCYDDYYWDPINSGKCAAQVGAFDGASNAAKAKAWPIAIIHHPLAYTEHRLSHFNQEMFAIVPARHWQWVDYPGFLELPRGHIEIETYKATDWLNTFPPTTPAVSLVLALSTLSLAIGRQAANAWRNASLILSLSAVAYTLGFFFVGVASMYRYHQYLLTAAPLSAILVVAGTPKSDRLWLLAKLAGPAVAATIAIATARLFN